MTEHTGSSYEAIADKYAQVVDSSPWHSHYERPAMLALFPPLAGLHVLDAGCGSGWYSEYVLSQGASVTAFDLNSTFVALTQDRVGQRATVLQADMSQPLTFAADAEFDLVICPLAIHYLKDWQPTFAEFWRVLKPGGWLIFSTHHPFMDWQEFKKDDYFRIELLEDEWDVGKVRFYRRPLTAMSSDLAATGFCIEQLLEPQPTAGFRQENPVWYERLSRNPWFLVIRARKYG